MENGTPSPGSTLTSSATPKARSRFEIAKGLCNSDEELVDYFVALTLNEIAKKHPLLLPFRATARKQIVEFWNERIA